MSDSYTLKIRDTKSQLNQVGPGFCLMKWLHETLYLHMGDNHSCYHPRPHKISRDEIAFNPSALHNTYQKKQARKQMLEGGRPDECYYCWNIEDLPGDHFSDRMIHSTSTWARDDLEIVKKLAWDADVNPRFLEVSFGNGCNFKCGYCCPQASSSWVQEIKQHGDYDVTTPQYSIDFLKNSEFYDGDDANPYVDAFWKWWPSLKNDLKVFRITGGEPLMNSNTFKLFDMITAEPMPSLELNMNSNLGVTENRVRKFSASVQKLVESHSVKSFKLYTSVDSWGAEAEYMRHGLKCDLYEKNLMTYFNTVPTGEASLMITFNVLCVANFRKLLDKVLEWRAIINTKEGEKYKQRLGIDTPYLKEPLHWMINILPPEFGVYMEENLAFMEAHRQTSDNDAIGFTNVEIEKFKRVVDYMRDKTTDPEIIRRGRRDFFAFFSEHDKRRGTSLVETFPQYAEFYELCRKVHADFGTNPRVIS